MGKQVAENKATSRALTWPHFLLGLKKKEQLEGFKLDTKDRLLEMRGLVIRMAV